MMTRRLKILTAIIIFLLIFLSLLFKWWVSLSVGLLLLGTVGYVEKIFGMEVPRKVRIGLLSLFIILSFGNLVYSKYKESDLNSKLQQAKDDAEFSKGLVGDLAEKEHELRRQLQEAGDSTALAKSQISELFEKNQTLQDQLKEAQDAVTSAKNEINDLAEYGEVSRYVFDGYEESGIFVSPFTPVARWTEGYLTVKDKIYSFQCAPEAMEHYKNLIAKCPNFPFPYLAVSQCLLKSDDPGWREYAVKAQSIMKKTTRIPGHSKAHDGWLERTNQLLDPEQMNSVFVRGKKES